VSPRAQLVLLANSANRTLHTVCRPCEIHGPGCTPDQPILKMRRWRRTTSSLPN